MLQTLRKNVNQMTNPGSENQEEISSAGDSSSAGEDVILTDNCLREKKSQKHTLCEGFNFLSRLQKQRLVVIRSANGLREPWTLQTSCESRGWEMSYCKPIKLHWTNTLWAFSRGDGRRPCLQHTHERTLDIRDGKRQWAKTFLSFFFLSSLYFLDLSSFSSSLCRTWIKTLKWEFHQWGVMDAVGRFTDITLDTKRGHSFLIFMMSDFINYWKNAGRVY